MIDEMAKRPVYWREAGGIVTLVANRYLKHESIRLYKEAVQQLDAGENEANIRASGRAIRQMADTAEWIYDERAKYSGPDLAKLRKRRDATIALAKRLESEASIKANVRSLLRLYCVRELRQYGEHLCDLEPMPVR